MTEWTASLVEERMQEAAQVLRRLPPVKVRGYFNTWPYILHSAEDKSEWEQEYRRLGPPDAASISRMEETLTWLVWLTPAENNLLWMRSYRMPWKEVCPRIGLGRTAAWRNW